MIYNTLGKTGLKVSRIGLGTAQFGRKDFSERQADLILKYAHQKGINFFDTSDRYGDGKAEQILGKFFKRNRNRKEVYFATKCGITRKGRRVFSEKYILKSLNGSLERLRTGYIDVFQLTNPDIEVIKKGEIFQILDNLKRTAKIRFSGISVGNARDALEIIKEYNIDTIQVRYNILDISARQFINKAHKKHIGVIIKSPLDSGVLSGNYTRGTKFPDHDYRSKFLYKEELEKRLRKIEIILKRFKISKIDLAHFSLKFLLSDNQIPSVLIGNSKIFQLKHNLTVLDDSLFSKEEIEKYISFLKKLREIR